MKLRKSHQDEKLLGNYHNKEVPLHQHRWSRDRHCHLKRTSWFVRVLLTAHGETRHWMCICVNSCHNKKTNFTIHKTKDKETP